MVLMWADPIRKQVGGGWALKIETFLGPVKWDQAVGVRSSWCPKKLYWGTMKLTTRMT